MGYLFIDDGYPESDEYSNNYLYFNGKDEDCIREILSDYNKKRGKDSTNNTSFNPEYNIEKEECYIELTLINN